MKLLCKNGIAGVILRVKIVDATSTVGAGKTGLAAATSGLVTTPDLIISTIADNESTATAYATADSNVETIDTLGTDAAPSAGKCRFGEVDPTNHPGLYEIQLDDARYAVAGARSLIVSVLGAADAAPVDAEIQLAGADLDAINDLLEADRVIDTGVSPWALVLIKKGTGALGDEGAVELLRQGLHDVSGAAVTNANTILGQSIT
jgi:hypothetical protein